MKTALRLTRWLLDGALAALVVTVLSLAIAANIGPGLGHQLVVIRGSSMSPAIPLGSVADVTRVQPQDLRVGDVVTIKSPGGAVYTHRIIRIATLSDGVYIETQGDAVGRPDEPVLPATQVTGRVAGSLPFLGYLVYMLSIPTGVVSLFSLALCLLMLIWLLEDFEHGDDENYRERGLFGRSAAPQPKLREWRIWQWSG
jgi:signal peptidase